MATKLFVNLPVKDLERSKRFFLSLGFSIDPQFTDEKAACLILGENLYAMLLTEPFFRTFTGKEICDAAACTEVIVALDVQSKDDVDEITRKAREAGGTVRGEPQDQGWMYGHGFADPDGHQWEVVWMDMEAMPQPPSTTPPE